MEYFVPVNILDSGNFKILFASIQPMRISVREEKKATSFQVEDGSERSDHIVESAKEIAMDLVMEGPDARLMYSQILQAWKDNTLVIVQTKVNSYQSMLIESIPHDEAPEFGGGISMPIRLKEWRSVRPQYGGLPPNKVDNHHLASLLYSYVPAHTLKRNGERLVGYLCQFDQIHQLNTP